VFDVSNAEQLGAIEDPRMWRLLLARLHPDAGGDHDLFTFACAVREELSGLNRPHGNVEGNHAQGTRRPAAPFLQAWQDAMGNWSLSNHEALRNLLSR
jgi:hypothetical protein